MSKDCVAVMNLSARANWKQREVEKKMCDALKELFADELETDEQTIRMIIGKIG